MSKPRAGTKLRQGLLPEPPWIDTEPPRPSCRSASTIKQVPRYFNLRFQQFDTRASVAELRWKMHLTLTMQKGAKARAQISIAASQLVEPMPVDRVKEIDPIDGHRTTKG